MGGRGANTTPRSCRCVFIRRSSDRKSFFYNREDKVRQKLQFVADILSNTPSGFGSTLPLQSFVAAHFLRGVSVPEQSLREVHRHELPRQSVPFCPEAKDPLQAPPLRCPAFSWGALPLISPAFPARVAVARTPSSRAVSAATEVHRHERPRLPMMLTSRIPQSEYPPARSCSWRFFSVGAWVRLFTQL